MASNFLTFTSFHHKRKVHIAYKLIKECAIIPTLDSGTKIVTANKVVSINVVESPDEVLAAITNHEILLPSENTVTLMPLEVVPPLIYEDED
jgi:hypothetical protein